MKNRRIVSHSVTLFALSALVVVLALLLRERTSQTVTSFDSPLPSPPPKVATVTKVEPTPRPTQKPTSTRPPEPTLPTPTPKPTLEPPTPTPEPLPTLIPERDTVVYSTTGEREPEIWRVQPDEMGLVSGHGFKVHTPDWWNSRVFVSRLHPSPSGRQIAVEWVYGEGGSNTSLLDVNNGYIYPLIDNKSVSDNRVEFLDWSPNGNAILVLGSVGNPELGGQAWEVKLDTNEIEPVDIIQDRDARQIISASYAPDGQSIVYAKSECYQCGSEIGRINLAQRDRHILLTEPKYRVGNVEISPDGTRIAYTLWHETIDQQENISGELWLMEIDGENKQMLSTAITGYHYQYGPVWSPGDNAIAFVGSEVGSNSSTEASSNLAIADIVNGAINQLTHLDNKQVFQPFWSPDGSQLTFVVDLDDDSEQFIPWLIGIDGRNLHRIGEQTNLSLNTSASLPSIVWLPSSRSTGAK